MSIWAIWLFSVLSTGNETPQMTFVWLYSYLGMVSTVTVYLLAILQNEKSPIYRRICYL